MLLGQYISKVAPKNRIAIPKKFRDELGQKLILSSGYERSLILLSEKLWQKLIGDATEGPFTSKEIRDTVRFLIGGAIEVEIDDQGRFILPKHLKDYAEVKSEVVFVGLLRWVEVWDRNYWLEYAKELENQSAKIGQKLKNLNLKERS